jgi:hypothetical protein
MACITEAVVILHMVVEVILLMVAVDIHRLAVERQ